MKVELSQIRLAVTAISKQIVATIPAKDGLTMKHKHDVSSDFLKCIIDYGKNTRFNISGGAKGEPEYQVIIKEKTGFKNEVFSRKEVVEFLKELFKETNISFKDEFIDEFIKKNLK